VIKVTDLSLKDMARKLKDGEEAETLMAELKRLGFVKSYVRNDTSGAMDFVSFLNTFWDWDTSPYIQEKLRKSHSIHRRHCSNKYVGDKDLSASRKNGIIKAGTKPLRWAFSKGKIERDPTRGHIMFSGDQRKRNILTPTSKIRNVCQLVLYVTLKRDTSRIKVSMPSRFFVLISLT
jgi:hypothetical protein